MNRILLTYYLDQRVREIAAEAGLPHRSMQHELSRRRRPRRRRR